MAFRAFYAIRDPEGFRTDSGQYTNAVYVFYRMLQRLVTQYAPTHVAVAFDTKAPTFRKKVYPDYKEGRRETPAEFAGQIDLIRTGLTHLGIATVAVDGIEADDIVATLAHEAAGEDARVFLVSGDRDMYQLITDQVTLLYPKSSASTLTEKTPATIVEEFGVPPEQYPELAALVGEKADNLPGVKGVGKMTAASLLKQFGGLDALLTRAEEVKGKRGERLRAAAADVRRNRDLNELLRDAELPLGFADIEVGAGDRAEWERFCQSCQFGAVREQTWGAVASCRGEATEAAEPLVEAVCRVIEADALSQGVLAWVDATSGPIGVDVASAVSGERAGADVVALAVGEEAVVVELAGATPHVEELQRVLRERADRLAYCDFKEAWHALKGAGIEAAPPAWDVAVAAYVASAGSEVSTPQALAEVYLHRTEPDSPGGDTLFGVDFAHAAWRAQVSADVVAKVADLVSERDQMGLLRDLELPLAPILARMEAAGIAVSTERLEGLKADLTHQVERARDEARSLVDRPDLNLASPKQLQEVLFDQLQMPPTRKTKRGYTTNAEALEGLYRETQHPFLAYLLEHRDKNKLLQTVEGLLRQVEADGRIHTQFQQMVTATGRLSSTSPNMQNIPGRTATGRAIREAFVPGEGFVALMTADYSQIEMRVMAALSGDQALMDALNGGEDLHRTMAAMVFGVAPEEVTLEQRSRIKATSYGLAYGLSSYGLARQLDLSQAEARALRHTYFARFGGVQAYLESLVTKARRTGYTETVLGRRRYLPELASEVRAVRQMAERAALNAPIQGSAADIIKKAMIDLDQAMTEAGCRSRLLLQVHDELILEVAAGEEAAIEALVRDKMEHAVDLGVPLEVSVGIGDTWLAAAH